MVIGSRQVKGKIRRGLRNWTSTRLSGGSRSRDGSQAKAPSKVAAEVGMDDPDVCSSLRSPQTDLVVTLVTVHAVNFTVNFVGFSGDCSQTS